MCAETRKKHYDVIVIGGGPGGYPAAIRAAQGGAKVALVEAGLMGGTCLNRGCIPTKTLLANADVLRSCQQAEMFGIKTGKISFDYSQMKGRKDSIVKNIRTSLEGLIKSNQIEIFRGFGRFQSAHEVKVTGDDNALLEAESIIIATGSEPLDIPAFPFDDERILSSTSILELTEVPKKIAIVGGGYIGCEFASLYRDLGAEVVIFEALDNILSLGCSAVSKAIAEAFEDKGIQIHNQVMVEHIENTGSAVELTLAGGAKHHADIALVSIGRKINSDKIGLDRAGVKTNAKGAIEVDERMETSVRGVYAIGDVTGIAMLAHVASHQGIVAAINAIGEEAHIDYRAIPSVIFTSPEVGLVGYSLEQAIAEGHDATVGHFPFNVLGKAQATHHTEGFAQIVTDKKTGQVLGAQVVGHEAANLIAEMGVVIHNELTVESVTETIHAHPTMAEAWLEAALIAGETPLHFPPKKKRKKQMASSGA